MSLTKELRDLRLINKLLENMNPLFSGAIPMYDQIINWERTVYAVETETANEYAVPNIQRGTIPIARLIIAAKAIGSLILRESFNILIIKRKIRGRKAYPQRNCVAKLSKTTGL